MKKSDRSPIHIYNNVAKFRHSVGLTQATLAAKAGITRGNLFKIEHGQVIPSVFFALRISAVLKTSVHKLFTLKKGKVLTEAEEFDLEIQKILKEHKKN